MAAVIETKCPECYELVKPRAADVSLVIETRLRGRYTFPCPECRRVVTKDADAGAIRALRYARVREVEAPTLSRRPDGPPLTEDDLIAFGRELESAIAVPTRNQPDSSRGHALGVAAGNSSGDSHVVVTVTGPEDQLAAFVEACKAIETLGQVGASRDVIVPVDGDGAASLRFDYGETDVSEIEPPEIDGDDVRITGIGYQRVWGPTASCPACAKHLKPHCPSKSCPWGRCGVCGVTWDRMARSLGNAAS